jgi:hypothetical protein
MRLQHPAPVRARVLARDSGREDRMMSHRAHGPAFQAGRGSARGRGSPWREAGT